MIEDRDLYEISKNHLCGGPINVRLRRKFPHGLEIPMAVTLRSWHGIPPGAKKKPGGLVVWSGIDASGHNLFLEIDHRSTGRMPPSRAELQEVLKQHDEKLAEAQNAQAELIRKQCELDDAKRAMDLTIEKQVQESLGVVRDKAKLGAEGSELAAEVASGDTTAVCRLRTEGQRKHRSRRHVS